MAKLKFGDTSSCPAMHTSSGGSGDSSYKIGDRVSDDSNNIIGTIGAFYIDGLDNEYAVCVLDSTYRSSGLKWMESYSTITGLPNYNDIHSSVTGFGSEIATTNTQLILDYCSSSGNSSLACSFCRAKTFIINGTTYYGQLPNLCELLQIYANHHYLGTLDITESSAIDNGVRLTSWFNYKSCWSSSQYGDFRAWRVDCYGSANSSGKDDNAYGICPVLEIPLN